MKTCIKPQYAAHGGLHFNFVLPSASLRALVKAHLLANYPTLNYCCEWKDVGGYGLMLAVAGWKTTAGVYHVPN